MQYQIRRLSIFLFPCFCLIAFWPVFSLQAEETPIPIWERPDYVLEASDVIEVTVTGGNISEELLERVNGTHLISPDGTISLGGPLLVQEMSLVQCEEAICEKFLSAQDTVKVHVKVLACNSKVFRVVYQSNELSEQRMEFPFTGHETVTKAIKNCHSEGLGLASGVSSRLQILRSAKPGKPVEIIAVDYDEALADPEKDLPLRSGDTVLLRPEIDEAVEEAMPGPDGPVDGRQVAQLNRPLVDMSIGFATTGEPQRPKRIARTVKFDGNDFLMNHIIWFEPLIKQVAPDTSISFVSQANDKNGAVWLILFGDEETVTELYNVFKEIAEAE